MSGPEREAIKAAWRGIFNRLHREQASRRLCFEAGWLASKAFYESRERERLERWARNTLSAEVE
jgi:hypothetical protein